MSARSKVYETAGLNPQSSRYYEMRKALDAYRAEVLNEAMTALDAIDGDCSCWHVVRRMARTGEGS